MGYGAKADLFIFTGQQERWTSAISIYAAQSLSGAMVKLTGRIFRAALGAWMLNIKQCLKWNSMICSKYSWFSFS
jgi:hypothetical protein